jgi:hypothetical protein
MRKLVPALLTLAGCAHQERAEWMKVHCYPNETYEACYPRAYAAGVKHAEEMRRLQEAAAQKVEAQRERDRAQQQAKREQEQAHYSPPPRLSRAEEATDLSATAKASAV